VLTLTDSNVQHFFLQRLPQIPHLRSLYIPYVADHVHGHQIEFARELALQVVDIVTLRPEIELCYMGITTKCFEILETKHSDDAMSSETDLGTTPAHPGAGGAAMGDTDDDSDMDNDDDEDDGHDEHGPEAAAEQAETETDDPDDSDANSDDDDEGSEDGKKRTKLKLREILFYDDKVSIFKARHGQL